MGIALALELCWYIRKDTKITAKSIIGKDEIIKSKGGQQFKLDKGGMLREFIQLQWTRIILQIISTNNQHNLLKQNNKRGHYTQRGKLLGADAKGNRFLRSIYGVFFKMRVPCLSQIKTINDKQLIIKMLKMGQDQQKTMQKM